MSVRQPTVSAGLVAGLVRFAVSKGASAEELYTRGGFEPSAIEDSDNRLPFSCYVNLMRAAKAITGDAALALHYGETVGMSELSIVGLLMEASATIGEAYLQMRRYGSLAMETDAISEGPRFEMINEEGRLFLVDRQAASSEFPELTEGAFAWLICGSRRYLDHAPVIAVQFTWEKPSYWKEYERIYQCPVEYGARWNALEMRPESLGWKVAQNPAYVFGMLTERADALLAELEAARTVSGRLQGMLAAVLHHGDISADAMAEEMGYSRQTLFRKLKEEGTSYTELLDNLRRRLAMEYLKGAKASVNETAYLVGFSDAASFSRAFKRWTGETPGNFRRSGGSSSLDT